MQIRPPFSNKHLTPEFDVRELSLVHPPECSFPSSSNTCEHLCLYEFTGCSVVTQDTDLREISSPCDLTQGRFDDNTVFKGTDIRNDLHQSYDALH